MAITALVATAFLTRAQLSSMMVFRGDALSVAGDPRSEAFYERALALNSQNTTAADRIIFHAIMSHDRRRLDPAVALADWQLRVSPQNAVIAMDRALCLQLLHRYRAAMVAFALVGARSRDPRALLFAADDASKLGAIKHARLLAAEAARIDPRFTPAQRALQRYARV